MTINRLFGVGGKVLRFAGVAGVVLVLAGCGFFSSPKIKEEPIVPAAQLYQEALDDMDGNRYRGAIETLEKLERQHPFSDFNEKAKLMTVYAHYRIGQFPETILAADRYIALYPSSKEVPYVLYLKGNSYFGQIKDTTRDQQISREAIDTYNLIIANYPKSKYANDAREKLVIGVDQLAGKEMSVGRYYLGNGQYAAAINRFRTVAEKYQTSTHIEEALYRLTEANLALGLNSEAQTAAAVLGHNYPASDWYKRAFELLQKEGLNPSINASSPLASLKRS
ncbi:outer membrane protein assembly factor BamD [Devosia sp.]|uniref:outer membrane protein assembly factor BamD n=1 Tax=Devosia sp. TaxID=1871048 RepID=UPI003A8E10BA